MMGMLMPWQQGDYIRTFICGFINFIFHLHAPRASVCVPARAGFGSHLRGGSVFKADCFGTVCEEAATSGAQQVA